VSAAGQTRRGEANNHEPCARVNVECKTPKFYFLNSNFYFEEMLRFDPVLLSGIREERAPRTLKVRVNSTKEDT
jgi:hypothetical protein